MHPILDPGPALLEEVGEVVPYPAGGSLDEAAIAVAAAGCAGIVSQLMDPIGAAVLATPGLRIVANVAVGYDNIDVAAASRHGVMATHTPGVLDDTTADFAFALMMAAARRLVEADGFTRGGHYRGWAIDMLLGQDINHATLGLVGIGRIGRAVARRARGFGMRVLYQDPRPLPEDVEREIGVTGVALDHLLAESDFVSLHVPLTEQTRHLISDRALGLMKPTAILVNTSRGPVIDEAALAAALREHRIFGAGLDVYEFEPRLHPGLAAQANVVLAPHIASASVRTRSEMCAMAAQGLATGLRGGRPANLLNPEVAR